MSKAAKDWCKSLVIADPTMKRVLDDLAYLHKDGRELFPAQATLAAHASLSVRSVRTALRLLEHFGFVERRPRMQPNGGRTSDSFVLRLDQRPVATRDMIRVARKAFRPGIPPGTRFRPPRNEVPPNRTLVEEPSQETVRVEVRQHTREADPPETRPRLTVVRGGRS